MPKVIDQLGREVVLPTAARRIVSTVPSQTELLFDLGLKDHIVGRTRFCIHPQPEVKLLPDIGGTKKLKLEMIRSLQPDLIIANKEENEKSDIESLMHDIPIYLSDVEDVASATSMIQDVGALTGRETEAQVLVDSIDRGFKELTRFSGSVAYLIWYQPYMASGAGTYIDHMLKKLGFTNVLAPQERYPEVSLELLQEMAPDIVMLSSEPFPFKQKHVEELEKALPNTKVALVDGEMFSWYGSRMLKATSYFGDLHKLLF